MAPSPKPLGTPKPLQKDPDTDNRSYASAPHAGAHAHGGGLPGRLGLAMGCYSGLRLLITQLYWVAVKELDVSYHNMDT